MGGREILAVLGGTRLDDDRMSLNRAWNIQWTTHLKVFPSVINPMDASWVGEVARCLVDQDRIVFPAVPKGFGGIQKLGRTFISNGVFDVAIFAEIQRFLVHP